MSSAEVRVTGVVLRGDDILVVRQRVDDDRHWSLPGGTWERGESLAEACRREVREETGLEVHVGELLYVAEVADRSPPLLHITFLAEPVGGELRAPHGPPDTTPNTDVRFVPIDDLPTLGFSPTFRSLAADGFPRRGSYVGRKATIGL
jgi:ADP-ribose pyrophosphatase YjhB (NUDIX family)